MSKIVAISVMSLSGVSAANVTNSTNATNGTDVYNYATNSTMMNSTMMMNSTNSTMPVDATAEFDRHTIPYMFPGNGTDGMYNSTIHGMFLNANETANATATHGVNGTNNTDGFFHAYVATKRQYIATLEELKQSKMRHLDAVSRRDSEIAELKSQLAATQSANTTAVVRIDTLYLMLKKELTEKRLMMESDADLQRIMKERQERIQRTYDNEKKMNQVHRGEL